MVRQPKHVIIVGDGMADYPLEALGGRTPLMAAKTPCLDWMAEQGEMGIVKTVPDGFSPGSEIANLSIFGFDPDRYYTGRGPLEAASMGIALEPDDLAFRCNLVTLRREGTRLVMEDFSAGHITDQEATQIILDLNRELGTDEIQFYPGVSYRHLMVWKRGAARFPGLEALGLTPPHDITEREVSTYLPEREGVAGDGGDKVLDLMAESQRILKGHPANLARQSRGLRPANSVWLWGQGKSPRMVTLKERFGIEGYVISAVNLLKGIGILAGLEVLEVPGATGYFDTNYDGKAQYALNGLRKKDFVYVHVEAPDEAGHMGDVQLKIKAIEAFDEKVVGTILKGMQEFESYKILVLPDHPTPIFLKTHAADPVPYVIYTSGGGSEGRRKTFDEVSARESAIYIERGFELIERFLTPCDRG